MPTTTIVDNPYVTVWYHTDTKIVHHRIHQFVTGERFREFLLAGSEALIKNGGRKWLSDDRSNSALSTEDMDWGDRHWFPQTARAGWKFWAIVQPEKVLAHSAMERLVAKYAKFGVTAKFFTDATEALKWLESQ